MKARYWSASSRIEILVRSTFWSRASAKQHVDRPFEAVEIEQQAIAAVGLRRLAVLFEEGRCRLLRRHGGASYGRRSPARIDLVRDGTNSNYEKRLRNRPQATLSPRISSSSRWARSTSGSGLSATRCRASARRLAPNSDSADALAATASISARLPLQCRTTSQPAGDHRRASAPPGCRPAPSSADVVATSGARRSRCSPRMIASDHRGRGGRRPVRVDRRVDDMRGHRHRHVGERAERHEVARRRTSSAVSTTGRLSMAVDMGAAVAGDVLDDRHHARRRGSPSHAARPSPATMLRIVGEGAVADDVVRAGHPAGRAPARNRR